MPFGSSIVLFKNNSRRWREEERETGLLGKRDRCICIDGGSSWLFLCCYFLPRCPLYVRAACYFLYLYNGGSSWNTI
uniref:Uncharacterized protein n=1 Tax=Nelumbo nucifera TaxID=4432 RepID=A0A822YBF5_NELNU|nr:TPA_asm: hypothetical protein HUJ06_030319 [Nelumbo nucifera]